MYTIQMTTWLVAWGIETKILFLPLYFGKKRLQLMSLDLRQGNASTYNFAMVLSNWIYLYLIFFLDKKSNKKNQGFE